MREAQSAEWKAKVQPLQCPSLLGNIVYLFKNFQIDARSAQSALGALGALIALSALGALGALSALSALESLSLLVCQEGGVALSALSGVH